MSKLHIGIAKCEITPEKSIAGRLGLDHLIRPGDPIFAKALAFKDKGTVVLTISCEIVGLTNSENAKIKKLITDEIKITANQIIILGTHTHSSPWVWDIQSEEAEKLGFDILGKQWMNIVIKNAAKAGIAAYRDLSEGTISYGKAETKQIVSNRVFPVTRWSITEEDELRECEVGLVDNMARLIVVKNKTKMAFLTNLACHPSAFGGGKTMRISPDFPYYTEQLLKEKYDIEFLTYWQGCAGNSNCGKFVKYGNLEEIKNIALQFEQAISSAFKHKKIVEDEMTYTYRSHSIKVGDFVKSPEKARNDFADISTELLACKAQNKELTYQQIFDWRTKLKKLDVSIISNGEKISIDLQLIKFGNLSLLFVPGEWYIENYLQIIKLFPSKNIVITTLNTFDLLYVPDESNFDKSDWYGVRTDMRVLGDEGVKELMAYTVEILKSEN